MLAKYGVCFLFVFALFVVPIAGVKAIDLEKEEKTTTDSKKCFADDPTLVQMVILRLEKTDKQQVTEFNPCEGKIPPEFKFEVVNSGEHPLEYAVYDHNKQYAKGTLVNNETIQPKVDLPLSKVYLRLKSHCNRKLVRGYADGAIGSIAVYKTIKSITGD